MGNSDDFDRACEKLTAFPFTLMNVLSINDPSQLRNFLRMSPIDFENFMNRHGRKLFRCDISMQAAMSVKEKLAVTLRYLASVSIFALISPLFKHFEFLIFKHEH